MSFYAVYRNVSTLKIYSSIYPGTEIEALIYGIKIKFQIFFHTRLFFSPHSFLKKETRHVLKIGFISIIPSASYTAEV